MQLPEPLPKPESRLNTIADICKERVRHVIEKLDDEDYLVRETKATRDFLKLRTTEADKVRCGEKHFETLGVPFAVAASADEV